MTPLLMLVVPDVHSIVDRSVPVPLYLGGTGRFCIRSSSRHTSSGAVLLSPTRMIFLRDRTPSRDSSIMPPLSRPLYFATLM